MVELASFEDPAFYDQLARARTSGMTKPVQIFRLQAAAYLGEDVASTPHADLHSQ